MAREVVVALVVVAFTPVKFWRVEEADDKKPPVKVWRLDQRLVVVVPKAREMVLAEFWRG